MLDSTRFPERKAAIEAEIKKRIDSGQAAAEQESAERAKRDFQQHWAKSATRRRQHSDKRSRRLIGWYQIISGVMLAGWIGLFAPRFVVAGLQSSAGAGPVSTVGVAIALCVLSLIAGYQLLRGTLAGYRLSAVIQGIQLIGVASPLFTWQVTVASGLSALMASQRGLVLVGDLMCGRTHGLLHRLPIRAVARRQAMLVEHGGMVLLGPGLLVLHAVPSARHRREARLR